MQVAERALFFFNSDYVLMLMTDHCPDILPVIFPSLYHSSQKTHWNK